MNNNKYISNIFRKILKENLTEKANSIMNKLNYEETNLYNDNEFDYVQEGEGMCESCGGMMSEGKCNEGCNLEENKNMCESCGGEMNEGECSECGNMYEIDFQELGGMDDGHPRFGNKKFPNKMSSEEIDDLLRGNEDDYNDEEDYKDQSMYNPYYGDKNFNFGDEDDSFLGIPDDMTSYKTKYRYNDDEEITEKLYGNQHKLDKNKNGKIDGEDFEMLRKQQDEEQLYEVEFEKELDEETNEGNEFSGKLTKARQAGEKSFKVGNKTYPVKKSLGVKLKESILFTETDLIDLIESLVIEEKNSFKQKPPKGYVEYDKAHRADKKENEDYLKSVAKKMTDYLKGMSLDKNSKYEMKETSKFPSENGGLKAKRKKYTPSQAVDDYIDAFSYPGQTNLVFDEIKPTEKNIEKYLKGHKTTGNAQVDDEGKALGNVVPSEVGEKFFKNFKDNLYGQEQMQASYKRQPQPVDQAGEETERGSLNSKRGKKNSQTVLNKLEESTERKQNKFNQEFDRIQELMGYNRKTQ